METTELEKDIKVFYVTAKSFPDGIEEAYKKLNALVFNTSDRHYYGLSRPDKGVIVYKAAVEELADGEAEKLGCETMIIQKGKYVCKTVDDFVNNIPEIGKTFEELLANPEIDSKGYCVESYFNDKDVRCMVKLK